MNPDDRQRENNKGSSSSNSRISTSDNNANPNLSSSTDESKGAIPKIRPPSKPALKKPNNNLEEEVAGGAFSPKILHKISFSRTSINILSNSYEDTTDPTIHDFPDRKSLSGLNIEPSELNIPIENDFLVRKYAEGNNSSNCSLNQLRVEDDGTSSDDNEVLSVSDDGCIYTYKGDHVAADLPSSFFNLEIPAIEDPIIDARENNSSPEMDFLEMDFDPGPSGDADSDSVSNAELENTANLPLDEAISEPISNPQPCCSKDLNKETIQFHPNSLPSLKNKLLPMLSSVAKSPKISYSEAATAAVIIPPPAPVKKTPVVEAKMPWSCTLSERTKTAKTLRMIKRHHNSKGELTSPSSENLINGDLNNLTFHNFTDKLLVEEKNAVMGDIKKAMIWTGQEACLKQITQVGPSACGATAVLNVLNALRFPIPTLETVQEAVKTRLRANASPLSEYLMSRSRAGCSHRDLIDGLYDLSNKQIYCRFFHMYPERLVNLHSWLGFWIENGAVPVATINLQKCAPGGNVPDSWHHQMIFGVGPEGIYLTNPLECVDASQLWPQLSSPSVLLVKSEDVIYRWNPKTDLPELLRIRDVRWRDLNVVGQVAKIVRESRREHRLDHVFTSHIKIPVEYKAGITLALPINSPAFNLLRQCPELPILHSEEFVASAL